MKVKSLRAVRIASLSGHIVNVPANIPYDIPDVIAEEAFAAGCVPCDGEGQVQIDSSKEEAAAQAAAEENLRRAAAEAEADAPDEEVDAETEGNSEQDEFFAAFEKLIETGDEADFNKITSAPKVGAMTRVLGKKVSAEAVDAAWGEYIKE